MTAGRELDRLVAEKVMGWKLVEGGNWLTSRGGIVPDNTAYPFEYSTSIRYAWEVVERMRELGFKKRELWSMYHGTWMVEFDRYQPGNSDSEPSEADTAPLAICLAALQALTHAPAEGG